MGRLLLEVIVQSVADARAAALGGADRLEVVRAIRQGGLTPAPALVAAIGEETPLPLRVMLREHDGFDLVGSELAVLERAAAAFAALGVDGFVAGFARERQVAIADLRRVLAGVPSVPVTFHRAFDTVADWRASIDEIASVPAVDRVLTSGGEGTTEDRADRLRDCQAHAGGRLTIVAGGGVTAKLLAILANTGSVREVHVGRAARDRDDPEGPVSADRVRRLRELAGV